MPEAVEKGRVVKVLLTDAAGDVVAKWSQQLPENPFGDGKLGQGLVEPPLSLENLIFLAERHPVHSAAIEQKTADVIGTGWEWVPDDEEAGADDVRRDDLDEWFAGLVGDSDVTMHELLTQLWLDVETVNVGYWEVGRDPTGVVQQVWHVPAHTIRVHKDGIRLAQARDNRKAWFTRWGAATDGQFVNISTGGIGADVPEDKRGNELLVTRRASRRSSWYGVPGYVSTIGWITLAIAVRDENLYFFSNRREPRWAIILTNIEEDPNIEEDLRQALAVNHQQPHRNLILPITGPGTVEFKKLSETGQDGSFEKLDARCDARILVGHRIPPERLGMIRVGPLGGNVTLASSRVYREAVVSTSQALLAARMNRFIAVEYAKARGLGDDANIGWTWRPVELDLTEEREDIEAASTLFDKDVIILNEARARVKLDPLADDDPRGQMVRSELKAHFGAKPAADDPLANSLKRVDDAIRELTIGLDDDSDDRDTLEV